MIVELGYKLLAAMPCLKHLNFDSNYELRKIHHDIFSDNVTLTTLTLTSTNLGFISPDVFCKILQVSCVWIRRPHSSFGINDYQTDTCQQLLLNRTGNESGCCIPKIHEFDYMGNAQRFLGKEMFIQFKNLTVLNFGVNDIIDIQPTAFSGLLQLQKLMINDNYVS